MVGSRIVGNVRSNGAMNAIQCSLTLSLVRPALLEVSTLNSHSYRL